MRGIGDDFDAVYVMFVKKKKGKKNGIMGGRRYTGWLVNDEGR